MRSARAPTSAATLPELLRDAPAQLVAPTPAATRAARAPSTSAATRAARAARAPSGCSRSAGCCCSRASTSAATRAARAPSGCSRSVLHRNSLISVTRRGVDESKCTPSHVGGCASIGQSFAKTPFCLRHERRTSTSPSCSASPRESLSCFGGGGGGGGGDGGDAGLSREGAFSARGDMADNMALFRADWDRVRNLVHEASRLSISSNESATDELMHIIEMKLLFADCRLSNASASSTTRMSFFRVSACCTSFVFTVSRTGWSASMSSTRCVHRFLFCLTRCFASPQLLMTAAIATMVCDMPPNAQGRRRRLLDR